jgi:2-carboxy-1,4-naphthoquinone phytyltransferase
MTIAKRSPEPQSPIQNLSCQKPDRELDQKKLWYAAIKPPMYSVAIIPITTGTAIAYHKTATVNWQIFTTFLVSAILILIWENLSNDVFDADTGIDKNKHHSLVNLTGKKHLIFAIANTSLALGIALVLNICWQQQDPTVLGIITVCCFLGYTYQGHPFRFGYQGCGEIIAFFCFGPLSVLAAYYSQTQTFSLIALLASTIIGITTSLILFCSHFHQIEDDSAAGKRSPIVQLGTEKAAQLIPWFITSVFLIVSLGIAVGYFPLATSLIFLTLPIALKLNNFVTQNHHLPSQVRNCKFIAVSLHFWSGLLLGMGFLAP